MAKKIKENSPIALQLEEFKEKINEYQSYLNSIDINKIRDTKERHNEVDCQIKIMNALPQWLAALEKLLEDADDIKKEIEVRGGDEMSGIMKYKTENK